MRHPQVRGQRRLACTGQDHGATMDVLRLNVTIQHPAFSRLPLSSGNDSSECLTGDLCLFVLRRTKQTSLKSEQTFHVMWASQVRRDITA
jgi:hypothetical protein